MSASDPDLLDRNLSRLRDILASRRPAPQAPALYIPPASETPEVAEDDERAAPPTTSSPASPDGVEDIGAPQIRQVDVSPVATDSEKSASPPLDQPSGITDAEERLTEGPTPTPEAKTAASDTRSALPALPRRMNWFRRILRRFGL